MIYKNSIKLIFSNFSLVWKLLVYLMICVLFVGCFYNFICSPILQELGIIQVLSRIPDAIKEFFASFEFSEFLLEIRESFSMLIDCVYEGFIAYWWKFLLLALFGLFLPYFIINFYMLSTCNVLHNYMGSCLNFGFTGSVFVNFWKNVRFTLFNTFVMLPIRILTFLLCIKLFVIMFRANFVLRIFAPFVFMIVYILLTSIRLTISCL